MSNLSEDFKKCVILIDKVARLFPAISELNPAITLEELEELYRAKPVLGGRDLKKVRLAPLDGETWEIIFRNQNPIGDSPLRLENAIKRVGTVIVRFDLIPLNDLGAPTNDARSREWLEAVHARLWEYSLTGGTAGAPIILNAINRVFNFSEGDIQTSRLRPKKYFGYRRSANTGTIVRFSMDIKKDPGSNLLRFDNYFRRSPRPWVVDGRGFAFGDVTYLLGAAKSTPDSETSKGVRFFTLQDYDEFGWVSGLLESRDNRGQPIAAKIVLIPAERHVEGSKLKFDPRDEKFSDYISKPINPAELKEELKIEAGDRHLLKGLSAEELVQALIWNGSWRTLHGEPQPIPDQKHHLGLRRMIEIQNRLRNLETQPPNDISFFMRLLSDERVYDAINEFLARQERPPKPGPLGIL